MKKRPVRLGDAEFKMKLDKFNTKIDMLQSEYPFIFRNRGELLSQLEVSRYPIFMDPRRLVINWEIPYLEKTEILKKCQDIFQQCMISGSKEA
jgi:hypothetical protein